MRQRNQDRLDNKAASMWQQYPKDERAQQAFWKTYEGLLAKAKKPTKNKPQLATPRPVAKKYTQNIKAAITRTNSRFSANISINS